MLLLSPTQHSALEKKVDVPSITSGKGKERDVAIFAISEASPWSGHKGQRWVEWTCGAWTCPYVFHMSYLLHFFCSNLLFPIQNDCTVAVHTNQYLWTSQAVLFLREKKHEKEAKPSPWPECAQQQSTVTETRIGDIIYFLQKAKSTLQLWVENSYALFPSSSQTGAGFASCLHMTNMGFQRTKKK